MIQFKTYIKIEGAVLVEHVLVLDIIDEVHLIEHLCEYGQPHVHARHHVHQRVEDPQGQEHQPQDEDQSNNHSYLKKMNRLIDAF